MLNEPVIVGVFGLIGLFLCLTLGVPIWASLAVVGFLGFGVISGFEASLGVLGIIPFSTTASFTFAVLPLFILMGYFAVQGGIAEEMYEAVAAWLGRIRGSLAMATTTACAVFGVACGSSAATAATFTKLALPEMEKYGYSHRLSCGSIAAGGTMAALIPPSGIMIVYCLFTEVSIGRMFIGGIIPGTITAILYAGMIYGLVYLFPSLAPMPKKGVPWKEKLYSVKGMGPLLFLMIVILGGIYAGIFTPFEAGGIGALVTFLMALIRKRLTKKGMMEALRETLQSCAMILLIFIGALVFGRFITISRIPLEISYFLGSLEIEPIFILIFILLIYIILGMFLEGVAMLALTMPILFPIAVGCGFEGVWFGILTVKMIEVALVSPPFGLNVYVVQAAAPHVRLEEIFLGVLPFLFVDLVVVALIIAFPSIVLWLPSMMIH